MTPTVGYKVLSAAGLVLAVAMGVLMRIGTTSGGLFAFWGVLLFAGIGLFALGRKLDSDARRRDLDRQRRERLDAARIDPGAPRI